MPYTRQEYDWIEAEWAYHLFGRTAFLSVEDFSQIEGWDAQSIPADVIISAMDIYFKRRATKPRPRSFLALEYLQKDIDRLTQLRRALDLHRGESSPQDKTLWDSVKPPMKEDPKAINLFTLWSESRSMVPSAESTHYIEAIARVKAARTNLVAYAQSLLMTERRETLNGELIERLKASQLIPETPVWNLAFTHHWAIAILAEWSLEDLV